MKYAAYSEYKTSNIGWIRDFPAHWELRRLKYVANRAEVKVEADEDNPLPYIGLEQVEPWTGRLVDLDDDLVPTGVSNRFEAGDTLFGKLRPYLAKACNVDFDGRCSSELLVLRGKAYDRKFLLYQLLSHGFVNLVDSTTYGSKMPRASWDFIGVCELPLPPLDEQKAIARFLDAKTAQIDALVAQKRQLIAKLKEKRSALITRTVTRGLPPEAAKAAGLEPNPELKDSEVDWIGYIPSAWNVERLRRVCRRVTDGAHISPDLSSDDFPFVSTVDIANGKIDMKNSLRTSVECYEYLVRTGCKPFSGDVLFSKDGTVGRTAVVDFSADFVVASSLVIISPDSRRLDSRFLDYWLNNSLLQQEVTLQMAGAALRRISVEKIGRLPVLLPSPNEQEAIVLYLEERGRQLEALVTKAEAAIDSLTEYRQALVTSAVTGKIDVRDWQPPLETA